MIRTTLRHLSGSRRSRDIPRMYAVAWSAIARGSGGTVTQGDEDAIAYLIRGYIAAGLDPFKCRINAFCGGNLASALVPIWAGAGAAQDSNSGAVAFVDDDVSREYGLTGAVGATSKGLLTGYPQNALGNGRHLLVHRTVPCSQTYRVDIGAETASSVNRWAINNLDPATTLRAVASSGTAGPSMASAGTGVFVAQCDNDGTTVRLYKDGTQTASSSQAAMAPGSAQVGVFAVRRGDEFLTAYSDASLGGYSIGPALTPTQVATITAAWQAYAAAMGRAVA
jgi:hypothetical protein